MRSDARPPPGAVRAGDEGELEEQEEAKVAPEQEERVVDARGEREVEQGSDENELDRAQVERVDPLGDGRVYGDSSSLRISRSTSARSTRTVAAEWSSRMLEIRGWRRSRRSIASTTRPSASMQSSSAKALPFRP